jgi:hypothetical protein
VHKRIELLMTGMKNEKVLINVRDPNITNEKR